ncbi:hypothetical protein [Halomonas sp. LBP4]|uniref:hypothetical protein n=1 Tax=Halomonas sp. LBP4 TaxID=2044917 RepID=UPI000D763843|nr:hypothetical protein [Halomonas sp. LBP4]PXX95888.1 hypothetical protein CR157_16950 [Halomonas sp. LBP4]
MTASTPVAFIRRQMEARGYPMASIFSSIAYEPEEVAGLALEGKFYHVDLIPLLEICYPSQGGDETPQVRIRNRFRQARVRKALDLIDLAYRGLCLDVWVDPSKGPLLTDQTTVNDDFDFVLWTEETEEGRELLTPSLAEARSQFVKDLRRRVVADCAEVFKELMAVRKA